MEIRVDRGRCAGAGLCVASVPAVFDQSDEDGRVRLTTPAPAPELARTVRAAAARCPSGAITLHDFEQTPRTRRGDEAVMEPSAVETDIRTAVREVVAPLWCEVLNVPEVSDEDDFFALGGHSLAAMHVMTTVEQTYEVELDGMRDVFEHPTLGAFVAMVASLVADGVAASATDGRAE